LFYLAGCFFDKLLALSHSAVPSVTASTKSETDRKISTASNAINTYAITSSRTGLPLRTHS
jgi:hypothetical protein